MYAWTAWCPKSPVYQLFIQQFVQANKEPPYIRIISPFDEGNPPVTPSNLLHMYGISIFSS